MNHTRTIPLRLIATLLALAASTAAVAAEPSAQSITSASDAASGAEPVASTGASPHVPVDLPASIANFCFFAHLPPASQKYKIVRNLKIGKGTYGSVEDILPKMAEDAQLRGADAIVDYTGSQRFGFWPWRMVRPVVRGVAVQWTEPKQADCESIGGTKLSTIMATGQAPVN
ncbi:hypothetical protein P3T18_003689 [Paraburkholderia sp. GAS199]|uniref:hypothetical protein n=1 Tax=Paraburkholderia sp. GAS199 TaxID=3035126 RepID=UPI003D1BC81C